MPSPHERTRNNVRTGVFVSATLTLAIIVVVIVSGSWNRLMRSTDRYDVTFPIADGVSSLAPGADVRVGGLTMGSVNAVEPAFDEDGVFKHVSVTFDLDDSVQLHGDAKIFVQAPLIGSDAWLAITALGSTGDPGPQEIVGSVESGMLASLLGPRSAANTEALLEDARATVSNVRVVSDTLPERIDHYDERIAHILALLDEGAVSARDLLAQVEGEDWPAWSGMVHDLLRDADVVMTDAQAGSGSFRRTTAEVEEAVANARPTVETMLANADLTVADAQHIVAHIRNESLDRFDAIIARASEGIEAASSTLETISERRDIWSRQLGEALANANLTAQRLKLTAEEVRRAPWKLLHRPTDAELEHELLYAAARSFALATADLRLAAETTQSLLEREGVAINADDAMYDRLQEAILGPLERYESAQERLIQVLMANESGTP